MYGDAHPLCLYFSLEVWFDVCVCVCGRLCRSLCCPQLIMGVFQTKAKFLSLWLFSQEPV